MPKISVIVPVYNVEPYLRRCVDSILNQTYTDFELILVDDGSPDGCPALCDEYAVKDSRVRVIHQSNSGLSAARNAGIDWAFANSDSEWLTFIDSDDWVSTEYLQHLVSAILQSEKDISSCSRKTIAQDGETVVAEVIVPTEVLTSSEALHHLAGENWVKYNSVCFKLYEKKMFLDIRFPVGKNYEDVFTMHELFYRSNGLATCSFMDYFYYLSASSIMRSEIRVKNLLDVEAFCTRYLFYRQHGLYDECSMIFPLLEQKYIYYLRQVKPRNRAERKYLSSVAKQFFHIFRLENGRLPFKKWAYYCFPRMYLGLVRIIKGGR